MLAALKLSEMGFNISRPMFDNLPYDLVADWNNKLHRIQVKSTETFSENRRYKFEAVNGADKSRYEQGSIDFVVCHVKPLDVWYVIPYGCVTAKKITCYPHIENSCGKYEVWKERWDILK